MNDDSIDWIEGFYCKEKVAQIPQYQVDNNIQQEMYALSDERKFCIDNMIDE